MTQLLDRRALLVTACLACLPCVLTACGDDETAYAADGGASDGLPAKLAPDTVISWNPKLTIASPTALVYDNSGADGSAFTAKITDATYTYELAANGIATLTIDGITTDDGKLLAKLPAKLVLTKGAGSALSVDIDGQTFNGTIVVPLPAGGGSGSGGGAGTKDVTGTIPSGAAAAHVKAGLAGSYDLQFGYPQTNAPFEEGAMETFVVGDDDSLTVMGKKVSNPYSLDGNAAAILWNDGTYTWELTDNSTGKFNEINVNDAKTNTWLGQWADPSKFEESPSDAMKTVTLYVSSSGMTGTLVKPPYAQGTEVDCYWDGAMQMSITQDGVGVSPQYVDEKDNTDGTRTLNFKDSASTDTEGYEYALTVDSSDKLVKLRAEHYKNMGTRLSGFSEAQP